MNIKNPLVIKATAVANEFIDKYMPSANGEYVKVYLYILRHEQDPIEVTDIADALNHTEADVRRALAYWKKFGILEEEARAEKSGAEESAAAYAGESSEIRAKESREQRPVKPDGPAAPADLKKGSLPAEKEGTRKAYTPDEISRLAENEEYTQLLYIGQKYMNRLFTQRDSEVMA